ncbi:MAG: OsmC family protein [Rhizobiaceae bacterium]
MATATVELSSVPGTEAAMGWAGGHTLVVDRPEGRAGGKGLGFNGAQLLGLALGGCFCNDLRYAAHELGVQLSNISVSVTIELDGEPLIARSATMTVDCRTLDGSPATAVVERAEAICTVANSLVKGLSVRFQSSTE